MAKAKKSIDTLLHTLEETLQSIDHVDSSLEDTLKTYEKSIKLSQDLLAMLDRQKETYTVLKTQADDLINKH